MLSILSVFCLLLVVSFGEESTSDFTYTDDTEYLGGKKTNVYHISEFSNVCFNNGEFHLFGESGRGVEQTGADIQSAGYHFQVHGNQVFSEYSYHVDKSKVNAVGVFLGTTSDELFQPYRLYNALIYLQRKGVSTKDITVVYIDTGKKDTEYSSAILAKYTSVLNAFLGNSLQIRMHDSICLQQMIFVTPQEQVKDIIYQMDAIYLRKLVYKGKPVYPISQRKPNILVNYRKVAPKWQSIDQVRHFFKDVHKAEVRTKYVTFGEMEGNAIVEVLKDTDILVTTYGEDSVFLLFMVPYSVLVEVQSDYFHDVTTSVMAYACDIYPIILRDVYSSIPAECTMRDNVVESEKEPCRSLLLARDIVFDVKSMTQAMYQSQYYLNNYKMKPVS
ncbi:hypothetical protein WA556_004571, partial [Blastocystis sp. ATCC 50177/Nand II]